MELKSINKYFESNIRKISFSQVIKQIIYFAREILPEKNFAELYTLIEFTSDPSLRSQNSEVAKVFFYESNNILKIKVFLNILSLYGASSPLPTPYAEQVLYADEEKNLSEFIDFFQSRLQQNIYKIWSRYRYYSEYRNSLEDSFTKSMLSLLGLPLDVGENIDLKKLLPFTGMLLMKQVSVSILQSIFRHYFSHEGIYFEQFLQTVSNLPQEQLSSLGKLNTRLNESLIIGTKAYSYNYKFTIVIRNLTWDFFQEFKPNGKKISEIKLLLNYIVREPFSYDLKIILSKNVIPKIELGAAELGWSTWLGSPEVETEVKYCIEV